MVKAKAKERQRLLAAAAAAAGHKGTLTRGALRNIKNSKAFKDAEAALSGKPGKATAKAGGNKAERREQKLAKRKADKKALTAVDWSAPAPQHLVARLETPQIKSKYQSYFEFAENDEKQEKKLEFQVTDQVTPTAGYAFVPIGDPELTKKCKELSRERDAMIFIVSNKGKEEGSRISQHVYRIGYHFRETIVDEARDLLGETVISRPRANPGFIEPIPETQEEINKQADGAIRDLFPRIPNTDRQMIIEHAFRKGGLFHGEPTVGLQPEIPLSRRVQLAVLAHIRHTHTRYDKLLRETSWINARKVVEPVCLDVLIKWRGDEETGRDQLDEILREVVIITDSEGDDDSSDDEDEISDEDDEDISDNSLEMMANMASGNQQQPPAAQSAIMNGQHAEQSGREQVKLGKGAVSARTRARTNSKSQEDRMKHKGFSRYKAAYEDALDRRQNPGSTWNSAPSSWGMHAQNMQAFTNNQANTYASSSTNQNRYEQTRYETPLYAARPETHYMRSRSPLHGNQVNVRSQPGQSSYHSYTQSRAKTPSFPIREGPSQVVRGSPARQSPQDTPIPSIENSSTFALPRPQASGYIHGSCPQDGFSRPVEQRLHSPSHRQVIVIDDSPQIKRCRVVRENDDGDVRVDQVSHGQNSFAAAPARPSHHVPNSSAVGGNFSYRAIESQGTEGLSRPRRKVYIDSETGEELPILDEPTMARQPALARPVQAGYVQEVRQSHMRPQAPAVFAYDGRRSGVQPAFAQPVYTQHPRALPVQAVRAEEYRPVAPPSQYNDMHHNVVRADRELVHSLSQSRLDAQPLPAQNHEFIVIRERGQPINASRSNNASYHENRPVQYASYTRARSPIGQSQRPIVHLEDHPRVAVPIHERRYVQEAHPRVEDGPRYRQQQPLPPARTTYVRSAEARRPVIVLD